jgi:hypothetical protein
MSVTSPIPMSKSRGLPASAVPKCIPPGRETRQRGWRKCAKIAASAACSRPDDQWAARVRGRSQADIAATIGHRLAVSDVPSRPVALRGSAERARRMSWPVRCWPRSWPCPSPPGPGVPRRVSASPPPTNPGAENYCSRRRTPPGRRGFPGSIRSAAVTRPGEMVRRYTGTRLGHDADRHQADADRAAPMLRRWTELRRQGA